MRLFTLEHSKAAYRADFALYGIAVFALAVVVFYAGPIEHRLVTAAWVAGGIVAWSGIEYVLHRFVLHGLQPFARWHAEHHQRPTALICIPTTLSALLIGALVFAPTWLAAGLWHATALTLGVLGGYLFYAIVHHGTHHWHAGDSGWLKLWFKRRKRWHALHHHAGQRAYFGVTSGFWDHVFGTVGRRDPPVAEGRS